MAIVQQQTLPILANTRKNIANEIQVDGLQSGFNNLSHTPEQDYVPSCDFIDVDQSVLDMFNKHLGFVAFPIITKDGEKLIKKPTVMMATGERFALLKQKIPQKDNNQASILPIISIKKTGFTHSYETMLGMGYSPGAPNVTFQRKIAKEDQDYQLFLNQFKLKNPQYKPSNKDIGKRLSKSIQQGMLLDETVGLPPVVIQTITLPAPQFYTMNYEITFWSQYTAHMNYMFQTLLSSYLPQTKQLKFTTDKGYWFLGEVTSDEFSSEDNSDDFNEEKKLVRYNFSLSVKAYLLASNTPGQPVPAKVSYSAPNIMVDFVSTQQQVFNKQLKNRQEKQRNGNQDNIRSLEDLNEKLLVGEDRDDVDLVVSEYVENGNLSDGNITRAPVISNNRYKTSSDNVYKAQSQEELFRFLYPTTARTRNRN